MTDDDDILYDMTMVPAVDATPEPARLFVSERHINAIEQNLTEQLALELSGFLPTIFVGEDGELDEPMRGEAQPWRAYFDGRIPLPWECAAAKTELENLIVERYRDRIAIARELGSRATQAEYVAACKREGIDP